MGISIHYRGRINSIAKLPVLLEEAGDIARTMGWPYIILDDDWLKPADAELTQNGNIRGCLGLKGIQMTPHPGSEPLCLFFDSSGYLRSPITMLMIINGTCKPENACVSMKTQFSCPETHIWVIGLLKYLKKRYISNLHVSDEGGYWETSDRQQLEENMAFINSTLRFLSSSISSGCMGDLAGLSADEIAERIEQHFMNRKSE